MNESIGNNIINPITKRLKEAREKSGISQKNLGIVAGIDEFSSSARMNQYETGKHTPDFNTLSRIAKILKVPTAYFYADDDLLAEIISLYGKLSKAKQKGLLTTIENLT